MHIADGEFGLQISDHRVVQGMIGWDEAQAGRVPLLSIDGREITWDELGRMLMSYEGWQFSWRSEIRAKSFDRSLTTGGPTAVSRVFSMT